MPPLREPTSVLAPPWLGVRAGSRIPRIDPVLRYYAVKKYILYTTAVERACGGDRSEAGSDAYCVKCRAFGSGVRACMHVYICALDCAARSLPGQPHDEAEPGARTDQRGPSLTALR
jgi:hypothetical protein